MNILAIVLSAVSFANPVFASNSFASDVEDSLSPYRDSIKCSYGVQRNQKLNYYIESSSGLGVYTEGSIDTTKSMPKLGKSKFGDLMLASPVLSEDGIVKGYNVHIELCDFKAAFEEIYSEEGEYLGFKSFILEDEMQVAPGTLVIDLISIDRAITNLGIDVLSVVDGKDCNIDLISKSNVWLEVGPLQEYPATSFSTQFFPIDTDMTTGISSCLGNKNGYWEFYSIEGVHQGEEAKKSDDAKTVIDEVSPVLDQ